MKFITYDLGTGGVKAALYDENMQTLAKSFIEYPTSYPAPGWHEQKPSDWWNGVVEISYLPEEHQNALLEAMDYAQVSPSLAQARRIRAFSDSGKLDANVLDAILSEEKPLERKVTLRGDKLQKFFPSSYTPLQMEKVITQLLEDWSRKQKERTDHGR